MYAPDRTALVGSQFVAQLFYGTSSDSLAPVTSNPVRFRDIPASDPLAGTWIGATRTLTGMALGEVAVLRVRAWDAAGGLDYNAAMLAGRAWGESATFTYRIPSDPLGDPTQFYIEDFRAFTLVPEPTLVALGIATALLMFLFKQRVVRGLEEHES